MCRNVERTFNCRPGTVAQSRRFVDETMDRWGVNRSDPAGTVTGDLILVASELVTNAARVSTSGVRLTLTAHRDRITLMVADDSPTPAALAQCTVDSLDGRGLAIVAALSNDWGQLPWDGREKVVWCEFTVPAGSVLAEGCQS
jgi:hypothetical protein